MRGCVPDICKELDFGQKVALDLFLFNGKPVNFYLKGACIGKAVCVGGWDIQKKGPKDMHKAVPGGSVYFFETEEEGWKNLSDKIREVIAEEIYGKLNFETWCLKDPWPSNYGQEYGPGKEGFGIALIGGW